MKKLFLVFLTFMSVSSIFSTERVELNSETAKILGLEDLAKELEVKEQNYKLGIVSSKLKDKLYFLPSDDELKEQRTLLKSQTYKSPTDLDAPKNYISLSADFAKNEIAYSNVPIRFFLDIQGEHHQLIVWNGKKQRYDDRVDMDQIVDTGDTGTSLFFLLATETIFALKELDLAEPKEFKIYAQVEAEVELPKEELTQVQILNIDDPNAKSTVEKKNVNKFLSWLFGPNIPEPPRPLYIGNGMDRIKNEYKTYSQGELRGTADFHIRNFYNGNHYFSGCHLYNDVSLFGINWRFVTFEYWGAVWEHGWNKNLWGDLRIYLHNNMWGIYHVMRHFDNNRWDMEFVFENAKEYSKTFYPGGYPITVTAGIKGTLSANSNMWLDRGLRLLEVRGVPKAVLTIYAWGGLDYSIDIGGIGFTFFQAGVKGHLDLITAYVELFGHIRPGVNGAIGDVKIGIIGPRGSIGPFVKYTKLESFVEDECHTISHWLPWPASSWVETICKQVTKVKPVEVEHYWPLMTYFSWSRSYYLDRF
jgi:hypothetical protein